MHTKYTPSSDRLLAIIELQNAIASSRMSSEDVMRVVVERASELTRASGTVVELVDGDEMVYRAVAGALQGSAGLRLKRATSLSGRCVQERVPLLCVDTEHDERVDREASRRVGARSMICVPLSHRDEAVGVLKVVSARPAAFEAEDVATLELLAHVIGVSLHQARAFEAAVFESRHDGLTGLWNRRAFDVRLNEEFERWKRYRHALTLVLFDLDGFKALNDRFGHDAGDEALRAVATILQRNSRAADFAFRLGGDEFALILPDTSRTGAEITAGRIEQSVTEARFGDAALGISAGLAEPDASGERAFVARADRALYENKRNKRR